MLIKIFNSLIIGSIYACYVLGLNSANKEEWAVSFW